MRTSVATLFGLLAGALSVHGMTIARRQSGICPGAEGTPLCCDVDVLGVADLDCTPPPTTPTDVPDFVAICAAEGKIDMCCLLPILDQGLICTAP
ncbi:hypothetical protein OIDMADRAFT_171502 [Oidiodendron maius Zn]|uniref:Hydrophobin n=1 Tax=Oidiodendron maius (strain Zn) TaxID=913774 RepID=A0A0C3D073_OIDMZ|nr:hypothetical protein OIDMADRAFT_171502 [Oidiodendron maius Zn]